MSFQTVLVNHTPFAAGKFVLVAPSGQEAVLVVLAATFRADGAGILAPVDPAPSVLIEDRCAAGESGVPSVLVENELALTKPAVDVVVVGSAYAPRGRPARRVSVQVQVGDVRKSLLVSGPRTWGLVWPRRPEPFLTMPVSYSRAFGGVSARTGAPYEYNPLGVGFEGAASTDGAGLQIPCIEYADDRVSRRKDRPRPAGLTPIGRAWKPRAPFAGTYDEHWLVTRWPVLPEDFDPQFNQSVPPDQQSTSLVGGELVRLVNLTPDGLWEFRLPQLDVPVRRVHDSGIESASMRLDTVVFEPEQRTVRLTARLTIQTRRGGDRLREVVLGHVSDGWMRARARGKRYMDWSGTGGARRGALSWR